MRVMGKLTALAPNPAGSRFYSNCKEKSHFDPVVRQLTDTQMILSFRLSLFIGNYLKSIFMFPADLSPKFQVNITYNKSVN